jgi:hypothetical protein
VRLAPHARLSPSVHHLQGGHKGHQVFLLWLAELQLQHQVKELDRIVERQQAVIVQVRRGIFDATQGEGLDGPIGTDHAPVHHLRLVEALHS